MPDAPIASEMSLEEMEEHYKKPDDAPKPEDKKETPTDDGAATAAITQVEAYKKALEISEAGRKRLEEQIRGDGNGAPPQPDPIEEMTDEQLERLIEEKGVSAGVRAVQAQSFRAIQRHLDRRLGGMADSSMTMAEAEARRLYPVEFELFGDQIMEQVKRAPSKEPLGNVETWRNLVAYIRGRDDNVEKLLAHKQKVAAAAAAEAARGAQRASAGVHLPSGAPIRETAPSGDEFYGLDRVEIEIADALGIDYRSYAREIGKGQ